MALHAEYDRYANELKAKRYKRRVAELPKSQVDAKVLSILIECEVPLLSGEQRK